MPPTSVRGLTILRSDARALFTVASKSQAAVDYLNALAGFAVPAAEVIDETA